jgi:putative nucleotidyltransferase with HDIG domain
VATVFVLGLAALADALYTLHLSPVPYLWVGLALLTIASDSVRSIKIPGLTAHVSPSEIFLFLIVLLFGGAPAVVTVAVGGLSFSLRQELLEKRHRQYSHAAFDLAEPAISIWTASAAYYWLSGVGLLWMTAAPVARVGLAAIAMSAIYFVMNSGLSAVAEAGAMGMSPVPLWRKYFKDVGINYVSNASVAVVLAVNLPSREVLEGLRMLAAANPVVISVSLFSGDVAGGLAMLAAVLSSPHAAEGLLAVASLAAVVIPLVIAPYYNLALTTARLRDQGRHVHQTEELIEKLAEILGTTAEAKDPSTSKAHIRRVRKFALELAARMGVNHPTELKAIRFAGLLHDYGKTVIREEFLNKPGKLSAGEYEIVKTHAAVGADMVSTFGFDFPVVPIIRHHHENWDGTGYPDRLRGEAIPLGARILSVVDCYDALRDHRPYRRALSHEAAMTIVSERAGTMYDPDVVRAFATIQGFLQSEPYEDTAAPTQGSDIAPGTALPARGDVGSQALPMELRLTDTATLLRLSQDLARLHPASSIESVCETASRHLLRLAPASLVVFYRRDEAADELAAVHASGFGEALARDLRMPLGLKVSGWVAANGRSVINEDSALDLDERLNGIEPRFRSLLSIPLVHSGTAIGVVTLYALRVQAFREDQRQALELVGPAIAEAFAGALVHDSSLMDLDPAGDLAGIASRRALDELLARGEDRRRAGESGRLRAVLCLKNEGEPAVMLHAMMAVSHSTRLADLIFRPTQDSLVVLMKDADAETGTLVLQRIAAALPADIVPPPFEASPLRLGLACGPADGDQWSDLLRAAQHRASRTEPAAARALANVPTHAQGGLPWRA